MTFIFYFLPGKPSTSSLLYQLHFSFLLPQQGQHILSDHLFACPLAWLLRPCHSLLLIHRCLSSDFWCDSFRHAFFAKLFRFLFLTLFRLLPASLIQTHLPIPLGPLHVVDYLPFRVAFISISTCFFDVFEHFCWYCLSATVFCGTLQNTWQTRGYFFAALVLHCSGMLLTLARMYSCETSRVITSWQAWTPPSPACLLALSLSHLCLDWLLLSLTFALQCLTLLLCAFFSCFLMYHVR
jgi:hypothetical protein